MTTETGSRHSATHLGGGQSYISHSLNLNNNICNSSQIEIINNNFSNNNTFSFVETDRTIQTGKGNTNSRLEMGFFFKLIILKYVKATFHWIEFIKCYKSKLILFISTFLASIGNHPTWACHALWVVIVTLQDISHLQGKQGKEKSSEKLLVMYDVRIVKITIQAKITSNMWI